MINKEKNRQLPLYIRGLIISLFLILIFPLQNATAHGISEESHATMVDGGFLDYVWLGAEHMLTGYDHLLFLFGVIFFLAGFRDVVRFITAFTVGHCITLLGATMLGITANSHLVDAVIALSVLYKGFENLNGFDKIFGIRAPNLLAMVFLFGLIHGFGLSTRLQELSLGSEGMVTRILAFNVGVETGQVVALGLMLGLFAVIPTSKDLSGFGKFANGALVCAGVGLFVFQIHGYSQETKDSHHQNKHVEEKGHNHGPNSDHNHQHPAQEVPQKDTKTLEEAHGHKEEHSTEDVHEEKSDALNTEDSEKNKHKHTHDHADDHTHKKNPPKKHEQRKDDGHEHSHGSGKKHKH